MEELSRRGAAAGHDASRGRACRSRRSRRAARPSVIFGLGLLLVYLTLAGQYESLDAAVHHPAVGAARRCSARCGAQWGRGLINDVYCQIGLVMLIGLSAKNGILIVEFAEQLRARGLSIAEAAVEAARIRLRPILMTSLAFILGVMPLVFASGAGRAARHSVGTAVAGGMLVSTLLNLVFIPVLYVVVRSIAPGAERGGDRAGGSTPGATSWVDESRWRRRWLCVLAAAGAAQAQAPRGPQAPRASAVEAVADLQGGGRHRASREPVGRAGGRRDPARAGTAGPGDAPTSCLSVSGAVDDHYARRRAGSSAAASPRRGTRWLRRGVEACSSRPSQWAQRAQAADNETGGGARRRDARRQVAFAAAQAYLAVIARRRVVETSSPRTRHGPGALRAGAPAARAGAGSRLNELRAQQRWRATRCSSRSFRFELYRAEEALGVLVAQRRPGDRGRRAGAGGAGRPGRGDRGDAGERAPTSRLPPAAKRAAARVVSDSWKDWLPSVSALFLPRLRRPGRR